MDRNVPVLRNRWGIRCRSAQKALSCRNLHLDFDDYARFIANKATWHPELETISEGTAKKLRSNLFKAMAEVHLFDKNSDTVVSFLPSPSLTDILMKRPDSFGFFPMRESSL